ncbi:ThiF family adenylyltransferase [Alicyclobacillus dauci]|uniref:ThiF family adenylyltransferase n=1 Tax=Alicyclobacillus dauci TaxID=1475485 RepID=A0ABY6YZI7_9BACL|nr:ThiF family adenylyltransferase [Alicyclobacillus dauci]WAH35872.1 ThiF family adenylyltransferase [Alicyclobacillus dauci]
MSNDLTNRAEMTRYARQVRLSQIGKEGQQKLATARVAIVGMGALGSATAEWLARAGTGMLRLIDRDVVEWSNLSRQTLYGEQDAIAATPKPHAAQNRLQAINSSIAYEAIADDVDATNALDLLSDVDIIVDGTDNYATRRLLNDVSVAQGIPWSYAGAVGTYGTTALFRPGETPCFACLFPDPDPVAYDTCDTVGVFGPTIGVIASLQAAAVMKYIIGADDEGAGVTTYDVWANTSYTARFGPKRDTCLCCGQRVFQSLRADMRPLAVTMCGRDTIQVRPSGVTRTVDLVGVAQRLGSLGQVQVTPHLLRFQSDTEGFYLFPNGRALVFGVSDASRARNIYARYIGM